MQSKILGILKYKIKKERKIMLKIKLKDNSELEVEEGLSVIEIAKK